jgi:2,4-dienoyl-CoA reductase-like NADH-dependent reductase (Old Yellow Enzyme family)
MMGTTTVHLLREVEKFLKISNVPATRFGREAMGDPRFVFDLRRGREPGPRTIERVRVYLETSQ